MNLAVISVVQAKIFRALIQHLPRMTLCYACVNACLDLLRLRARANTDTTNDVSNELTAVVSHRCS